jgi:hypothetical protein
MQATTETTTEITLDQLLKEQLWAEIYLVEANSAYADGVYSPLTARASRQSAEAFIAEKQAENAKFGLKRSYRINSITLFR